MLAIEPVANKKKKNRSRGSVTSGFPFSGFSRYSFIDRLKRKQDVCDACPGQLKHMTTPSQSMFSQYHKGSNYTPGAEWFH